MKRRASSLVHGCCCCLPYYMVLREGPLHTVLLQSTQHGCNNVSVLLFDVDFRCFADSSHAGSAHIIDGGFCGCGDIVSARNGHQSGHLFAGCGSVATKCTAGAASAITGQPRGLGLSLCVCVCVLGEGCLRDTTQGRTFHVLIFLLLLCLHRWTGGYGAGSRVFANPPRLEGEEAVVLVPASSFQGELSNARLLSRE